MTSLVTPTRAEDIEAMAVTFKPERAELIRNVINLGEEGLAEQCSTLWCDGRVLAIAGVVPMTDPGYLVAFAFLDDEARSRRLTLTRWAKQCMDVVEARFAPRRLEITVECDKKSHLEWGEVLGFEWEGSMRNYGLDGTTHERMARIW